jgi:hypothetical protein
MKISRSTLRKMIVEEMSSILSHDNPSDVEAQEDAMAGGENLELPIDHVTALGFPEQPSDDDKRLVQIVREELGNVFPKKIKY